MLLAMISDNPMQGDHWGACALNSFVFAAVKSVLQNWLQRLKASEL
jgi:uncharacterized membrane protein YvlD (DUF360 family)